MEDGAIGAFNLSDIFEYLGGKLPPSARSIGPGRQQRRRLAYWNTLAERHRPDFMADRLRPLTDLSRSCTRGQSFFLLCVYRGRNPLSPSRLKLDL